MRDFTALVPTIVHESGVRQLALFTRRWYRLRVSAVVAATVALTILVACFLAAPTALTGLPIGSLALLALLLYDFGELTFQNLYAVRFMGREAQLDHRLFWPSPVDAVEVQDEMRVWGTMQFMVGIGVTVSLAFAVVLVSLDSALVPPLAAGFVVWGYVTTLASVVGVRSSVRTIVTRIRDRNLAVLQRRIDAYGPRFAALSPREADDVERLISLHASLRDAPSSPGTSQALVHAVVALVIPTAMFVVTVFGEVIAERFLDALLP